MTKYIAVFFVAIALLSCNSSKKKLIPRDKLISILADIHLADGYYATHAKETKNHNDSTFNFYNHILSNYGYTRADFDSTIKYYTIHSQDFDILYEEVVTILNKTEQESYQGRPMDIEGKNIWSGKNSWYLPQEGGLKKIPVNLKLRGDGKYNVYFTCKTFKDDKSVNPRLTLYFAYDSGKTEKKDTFATVLYTKDARTTMVSVTKTLTNKKYTHLRGFILNNDNNPESGPKHVIIEGFKVQFVSNSGL